MRTTLLIILLYTMLSCNYSDKTHIQLEENIKENAWNTVKDINRYWAITEDMDSLRLSLHPEMVIVSPDGMICGRDSIIRAYTLYTEYAETLSMDETEPIMQLYNDNNTAVINYKNALKVKTNTGEIQSFSCRDTYTLIFDNNKWIAVSQHYSFIKN